MSKNKTHYRAIAKSEHLGVADLEDYLERGSDLIYTIKEVKQYQSVKVAGKNIAANIAFFTDVTIKPLVLNQTNAKIIKGFANSPFVEDWSSLIIQLYIDENVKMKGELVGGVRIRPIQPKIKDKPLFTEDNFEKAKTVKATIEVIKTRYSITPEMETKYNSYVAKK